MSETKVYQLPRATALLQSHLARFQRMLMQNLQNASDPFFDEEAFFFSIVALANYLKCSVSTVERLIKRGFIKKHRHGNHVFFIVSEVLKAIAENERIAAYLTRKPKAKKPRVPKIYYECYLSPGECMFIDLRHQGWKATVVCHPQLWGNKQEIENLLHRVVDLRQLIKPFRIITSRPE